MRLTQDIIKKISDGNAFEYNGLYDKAEACYLDAVKKIDKEDKATIGPLYINLGANSVKANRTKKAVKYFQEAISQLTGLKGEAILQNAHAHFNIAKIYSREAKVKGLQHIENALQLYRKYPFTSQADIADALAVHAIALVINNSILSVKVLSDTWVSMKALPFESLDSSVVRQFLSIYLAALQKVDSAAYQHTREELQEWADEETVEQISEMVDPAFKLRRRLQRALF